MFDEAEGVRQTNPLFLFNVVYLAGWQLAGNYGIARVQKMAQALISMDLWGKDEGRCSLILVLSSLILAPIFSSFSRMVSNWARANSVPLRVFSRRACSRM